MRRALAIDHRLAVVAAFAPLLIPTFAWHSFTYLTNSNLVCAAGAAGGHGSEACPGRKRAPIRYRRSGRSLRPTRTHVSSPSGCAISTSPNKGPQPREYRREKV